MDHSSVDHCLTAGRKRTYGEGGFGSKSTFSISSRSSLGSEQKNSGLSPGTANSSLTVIWLGIHDERAETETAEMAASRSVVSLMMGERSKLGRLVVYGEERGGC